MFRHKTSQFQINWIASALMASLMESGEALRDTTARANERQVLQLFAGIKYRSVRVERNGQEAFVPLEEVKFGDRVIVCAGECIPVSGRVLRVLIVSSL